jgi:hypothetical protein
MIIMQDRDPTHLSSQLVQQVVGKVLVLSPQSPGLNPLVYAVILNSKRQLEQNMPGDRHSRRNAFVEHIQKTSPDAHVAGYTKSLESVKATKEGLVDW